MPSNKTTVRRRGKLSALAVTTAAMLALATASPAVGTPAEHSTSPVLRIADVFSGQPPVPVGASTLVRTDNGVTAELGTSVLASGDIVTTWWVVFTDPDSCRSGIPGASSCGPADVMHGRGGVSSLRATGRIVDDNGTAGFGAHLRVGDTARALIGDGLTHPAAPR